MSWGEEVEKRLEITSDNVKELREEVEEGEIVG